MDAVTGLKTFSFGLTMILTIFLNGIVLLTFHVDKHRRLSTKCIHVFITNLAVCQLLIGLIVMPFVQVSILYDGWKSQRILCQLNGFSTSVCFYTSVLMLCVISLDRYVAIVMATRYQKLLTRRKGVIIVIFIWSLSSVLSLPPLIGWSSYQYHPGTHHCSPLWIGECGYFYFTFILSVIIPISFTIFSYSVIFWKVRKHRKRISLWKHASHSLNVTHTNEGQDSMSHIEMSHVVTVNPEPRFSKTPTVGMSPITNRKSPLFATKTNQQFLATPRSPNANHDQNSNASSGENNGPSSTRLSSSTSRQALIEDAKDDKDDMVSKTTDKQSDSESKSSQFRNQPIFYNPNKDETLQSDVINIKVREFGNKDPGETDLSKDDETGANSRQERPIMVSTDEALKDGGYIGESKPSNAVVSGAARTDMRIAARVKKTSKTRSNQDFQHVRLSEDAENELLNLSETNLNSDHDGGASSSSGDSTTTGVTGNGTTRTAAKITIETAEEINVVKEKLDVINLNKVAQSKNQRKNAGKKFKSNSKRRSKNTNTSRTLREFQVAKTGAILLTFFMMCFGPYTIVHLCHLPFPVPLWAQHIAMWCVFFNSILSPLIYGFMNKDTRKKVREILCKCSRSHRGH